MHLQLIDLNCKWWEYVSWYNNKKPVTIDITQNWNNYINAFKLCENKIDLVLIDGRFRVAVLLSLYNFLDYNCVILFHDYSNRQFYHIVENFYNKIESCGTLQVFKKKKDINIELLNDYIEEYKLVID